MIISCQFPYRFFFFFYFSVSVVYISLSSGSSGIGGNFKVLYKAIILCKSDFEWRCFMWQIFRLLVNKLSLFSGFSIFSTWFKIILGVFIKRQLPHLLSVLFIQYPSARRRASRGAPVLRPTAGWPQRRVPRAKHDCMTCDWNFHFYSTKNMPL